MIASFMLAAAALAVATAGSESGIGRDLASDAFRRHSLVLLPVRDDIVDDQHDRVKREVHRDGSKKYRRLAHSVHVRSEVRFR